MRSVRCFAQRTFEAWKLGRKDVDNGVLIVEAFQQGKVRIQTGKGLQGVLPDIKARQIIDAMIAKGVFVRDRTKDPSTPTCFRITTGVVEHTRTATETLEAVCARLR